MPDKTKSKGFLERIIPLKSISGDPQYDISEVVNDAGDEQFKKLYEELMNTRKLLLMYRLLHHNDAIPNVKLNLKNRYKQLTKPLIRLFQNSESLDGIIKSLSKYLIEKNEEKINSLDSGLLFLIIDLVAKHCRFCIMTKYGKRQKTNFQELKLLTNLIHISVKSMEQNLNQKSKVYVNQNLMQKNIKMRKEEEVYFLIKER